jgi:hypothetical protein
MKSIIHYIIFTIQGIKKHVFQIYSWAQFLIKSPFFIVVRWPGLISVQWSLYKPFFAVSILLRCAL